jgi:hypothetical protein
MIIIEVVGMALGPARRRHQEQECGWRGKAPH